MAKRFPDTVKAPMRISTFIEKDVWEALQQVARERAARERRAVTASMLLREAMREYLFRRRKGR